MLHVHEYGGHVVCHCWLLWHGHPLAGALSRRAGSGPATVTSRWCRFHEVGSITLFPGRAHRRNVLGSLRSNSQLCSIRRQEQHPHSTRLRQTTWRERVRRATYTLRWAGASASPITSTEYAQCFSRGSALNARMVGSRQREHWATIDQSRASVPGCGGIPLEQRSLDGLELGATKPDLRTTT